MVSESRQCEAVWLDGWVQNYESGGQEFESLRARQYFKDLALETSIDPGPG